MISAGLPTKPAIPPADGYEERRTCCQQISVKCITQIATHPYFQPTPTSMRGHSCRRPQLSSYFRRMPKICTDCNSSVATTSRRYHRRDHGNRPCGQFYVWIRSCVGPQRLGGALLSNLRGFNKQQVQCQQINSNPRNVLGNRRSDRRGNSC